MSCGVVPNMVTGAMTAGVVLGRDVLFGLMKLKATLDREENERITKKTA